MLSRNNIAAFLLGIVLLAIGCVPSIALIYPPYILCGSGAASSVTGTTTLTTLATCTLPGGALGPNGHVHIFTYWTMTGSTNSKIIRSQFGNQVYLAETITALTTIGTVRETIVWAANSRIAQVGSSFFGANTTNFTSSVDTKNSVAILLTGQLSNTSETITLAAYSVVVYP